MNKLYYMLTEHHLFAVKCVLVVMYMQCVLEDLCIENSLRHISIIQVKLQVAGKGTDYCSLKRHLAASRCHPPQQ